MNIWQPDEAPAGGPAGGLRSTGTYLAPSTIVVVENVATASVPTASDAVQPTSAPPSPEPAARNAAVQRNGGHHRRAAETERSSTTFVVPPNYHLLSPAV